MVDIMKNIINLNDILGKVDIDKLPCGKNQNIEVKIGRKLYMVDVDKDMLCAHIDFYKKVKTDRKAYSKYDSDAKMVSVTVRNDVRLDKNFFENIEEISKAQTVYDCFGNLLYK